MNFAISSRNHSFFQRQKLTIVKHFQQFFLFSTPNFWQDLSHCFHTSPTKKSSVLLTKKSSVLLIIFQIIIICFRIPYIQTSAASGENVNEAVKQLLDMVMKRMKKYVESMGDESSTTPKPIPGGSTSGQDCNKLTAGNATSSQKSSCPC